MASTLLSNIESFESYKYNLKKLNNRSSEITIYSQFTGNFPTESKKSRILLRI